MIYIVIIGLPTLLAFLSDNTRGFLSKLLFCCAMLVPCFFAGVRDLSIGTDVMTYGYWTFLSAKSASLLSFLNAYSSISAFGFNLFSWLIARTGSFELYLAMIQGLTVLPICLYAKRRYPRSSWIAVVAYMLLLFPVSLNAMKQMIAVALCVPAFEHFDEKRPVAFCLTVAASALLFHQTAIVALLYWPASKAIESIGGSKAFFGKIQSFALFVIAMLTGLFIFIFGERLVSALSFLKDSYSYQVNASGTRLNYSAIVLLLGSIIIYLTNRSSFIDKGKDGRDVCIFALFSIVGAVLIQLNLIANSLMRFSYYALSFYPLFASGQVNKAERKTSYSTVFLLLLLIAYFVQTTVINGGNQVYPYTSTLLGIQ